MPEVVSVTIKNINGIHARPAAFISSLAERACAKIFLTKGSEEMNLKSIMNILMVETIKGDSLDLHYFIDDKHVATEILKFLNHDIFEYECKIHIHDFIIHDHISDGSDLAFLLFKKYADDVRGWIKELGGEYCILEEKIEILLQDYTERVSSAECAKFFIVFKKMFYS